MPTVVKVVGTARDDINGLLGMVVSYNVERERYLVHMPVSQSTMALKKENLVSASTVERYRAQWQQLQNDPRVREKVAHYLRMAQRYVAPVQLQHAIGGALVLLTLLVYLVGFTKMVMTISLLLMLGVMAGPDVLARSPPSVILRNFPNRARETFEKQVPFLKGRLSNRVALGVVLLLVVLTVQSLLFTGTSSSSGSGAAGAGAPPVKPPPISAVDANNQPRLDREAMQKFYNMGFDDATNVMEHGHSLRPILQRLLEQEAASSSSEGSANASGEDNVDDLYLSSTMTPPATAAPKSIVSKLVNFSTLGSLFYVYRMLKDKGIDQSTGLFSLGQLAANLQHHTELWQQGMLLFSVYNVFRVFWS